MVFFICRKNQLSNTVLTQQTMNLSEFMWLRRRKEVPKLAAKKQIVKLKNLTYCATSCGLAL
jgi:hypothetical protein